MKPRATTKLHLTYTRMTKIKILITPNVAVREAWLEDDWTVGRHIDKTSIWQ